MRHRLLPWLALPALLACGVGVREPADPPAAPAPPRPTVNHALHTSRDVLCTDCHDPKETGTPTLPSSETCFECHDQDLSKESERVRAYFDAVRQEDGTYRFARPEYMGDLIVAHDKHAAAKVDCASCHGQPSENAFARPAPLALMDTCVGCHEGRPERRVGCDVCHSETRKEVAPATHAAPRRWGCTGPPTWRSCAPRTTWR